MNNRFQIAKDFADSIKSKEIKEIILFGSVARGEDTAESDIDVLIVLYEDNKKLESLINEKTVDILLDKREIVSPHIMTVEHFNEIKDFSFLKNVLADGVLI